MTCTVDCGSILTVGEQHAAQGIAPAHRSLAVAAAYDHQAKLAGVPRLGTGNALTHAG
jgi:hypothetical protein